MKKTVEQMMTENVHSIGSDIPILKAREQMKRFGVRHLPVLRGGRVVGILSERDILLVSKFAGYESYSVEDAMTPDPYVVRPETLFSEVVSMMAERKIGSAVVAVDDKPIGIFTAVDGLKLLAAAYK